jgi:C-terminal processing protease CtpA/Prc
MKMKKAFLMMAVAGLVFALPAIAGEGHDHAEKTSKCNADAQACLNYFADNYKGRGWAGVSLEKTDDGLSVAEVHPGTPAAQAGIKVGDVLLAINGMEADDEGSWAGLKDKMVPGNELTYTVNRNGKNKDVSFTLAEMPMDVVARMVGMHMLNDHAAVEIAQADD